MSEPTMSENVYTALSLRILNGDWPIGTKLPSENQLCVELGVSRVTIRSAMQRLKAEHLIVTAPRKGSFVTATQYPQWTTAQPAFHMDFSKDDYQYFFEFRQFLELSAGELFAQYGEAEDFSRLEEALKRMMDAPMNSPAFTQADIDFHIGIVMGSRNPLFISTMHLCHAQYDRFLGGTNEQSLLTHQQVINDHQQILTALKTKDLPLMQRTMTNNGAFNMRQYFSEV